MTQQVEGSYASRKIKRSEGVSYVHHYGRAGCIVGALSFSFLHLRQVLSNGARELGEAIPES